MSSLNAIEEAWQSYQITVECLAIVARVVRKNNVDALDRTSFFGMQVDDATTQISSSRSAADDYVILSMWALFERHLFFYLQEESRRMLDKRANLLAKAIQKKIENDFEFWRFDDALNLLKYVLDPQLVGQAKQIKQYRDWIAHRNPKKPPKTNVSPEAAYRVLSTIVSQLSTNAN